MIARVHWILHYLPTAFKGAYRLSYDYALHRYIFYRLDGRKLYDVFICERTSKHYFKCVYANLPLNYVEFFGGVRAIRIAEKMTELYYIFKGKI